MKRGIESDRFLRWNAYWKNTEEKMRTFTTTWITERRYTI
ncbi:putative phage protein [Escherichia coli 2-052-05_S3_C1]|nr:putative phage protein [Escherichia coli 2-052-05_S3_C1]